MAGGIRLPLKDYMYNDRRNTGRQGNWSRDNLGSHDTRKKNWKKRRKRDGTQEAQQR